MAKRDANTPPGELPTPPGQKVPVELGNQPFIDERVTDPTALRYARSVEGRRRPAPLPKYTTPVAGGEDVPIPRLDLGAREGQTMAEQAQAARQAAPIPAGIVTGTAHTVPPKRGGGVSLPGLLPGDMLPEPALSDPAYQQGSGSRYAASQPHLAQKYGVLRSGAYIPPQKLMQSSAPGAPKPAASVRPETLEGLRAIEEFNQKREQVETGELGVEQRIEQDARATPAGKSVGKTEKPLSEAEKKALLNDMDEFDLHALRNALLKDLLNNEQQRKLVESRLKPLDIGQLIAEGRVTQVIPIKPGVFEPEFQSYSGNEDLVVKRLISAEQKRIDLPDQYLVDKFVLLGLTISLVSVNKHQLPDYRGPDGLFDEDLFWKKYAIVSEFNMHMIASLAVHWFWFDLRVRRLFVADDLGNG